MPSSLVYRIITYSSRSLSGPTLEDVVDIMPVVCGKWRKIGIRTGQSDRLDGYATKALNDIDECCERVFRVWIAKGGHPPKYPHTWQGLYDLLCDIKHDGIANKMADEKAEDGVCIEKRHKQT